MARLSGRDATVAKLGALAAALVAMGAAAGAGAQATGGAVRGAATASGGGMVPWVPAASAARVMTVGNLLQNQNASALGWDCLFDDYGCPNVATVVSGALKQPGSDLLVTTLTTGGMATINTAYYTEGGQQTADLDWVTKAQCLSGKLDCVLPEANLVRARNWTQVLDVAGSSWLSSFAIEMVLEFHDKNGNGVYDGPDEYVSSIDLANPLIRWLPSTLVSFPAPGPANGTVFQLNATTFSLGFGPKVTIEVTCSNVPFDGLDAFDVRARLVVERYDYSKTTTSTKLAVQVYALVGSVAGSEATMSQGSVDQLSLFANGLMGWIKWDTVATAEGATAAVKGSSWVLPSADQLADIQQSAATIPFEQQTMAQTRFFCFDAEHPSSLTWSAVVAFGQPKVGKPSNAGYIIGITVAGVCSLGLIILGVWVVKRSKLPEIDDDRSVTSRDPSVPLLSTEAMAAGSTYRTRNSSASSADLPDSEYIECKHCGYATLKDDIGVFCESCGSRILD